MDLNNINSKIAMPRPVKFKLVKIENREKKYWDQPEEKNNILFIGEGNISDSEVFIRNWKPEEEAQHFSKAKGKELPTQFLYRLKITSGMKGIWRHFQMKKSKRTYCWQSCYKRMAPGSSVIRKEMKEVRALEYQERRKNMISKYG